MTLKDLVESVRLGQREDFILVKPKGKLLRTSIDLGRFAVNLAREASKLTGIDIVSSIEVTTTGQGYLVISEKDGNLVQYGDSPHPVPRNQYFLSLDPNDLGNCLLTPTRDHQRGALFETLARFDSRYSA